MSFCSKVRKHRPSSLPTWRHWRLFTWGVSDRHLIYAGGLMSPMQRCFSELVCQPFVTYLLLRHRRLSLFGHVARLDHGVPLHDALRLMLDTYEGRRPMATWRRPLGRPDNANKVQEDANALPLSTLWRCEITTVMQRHNGRWWWWYIWISVQLEMTSGWNFSMQHKLSHFTYVHDWVFIGEGERDVKLLKTTFVSLHR